MSTARPTHLCLARRDAGTAAPLLPLPCARHANAMHPPPRCGARAESVRGQRS